MIDQKEWTQNKAEELALELTGHDFYELGTSLQLMLWLAAEQYYINYYSSLIDSIYEREKDRQLLG